MAASLTQNRTTVSCSATDSADNTGTSTFTVTVVRPDTTAPVLTVPDDITRTATGSDISVSYSPSAQDNVDGTVRVLCTPPSGSSFSIGTATVTCMASDSAGNTARATFTVTVLQQSTVSNAQNVDVDLQDNSDRQDYIGAVDISESMIITEITLSVTLTHQLPDDLVAQLVAPNGETVQVMNQPANIPENTEHTYTVSPSEIADMDNFLGDDAQGVWRLRMGDYAAGNTGTVASWNIEITGTLVANGNTIQDRVFGFWADPNITYFCDASLANLRTTDNVDACADLANSANRWNRIDGSAFTLTQSASSDTAMFNISAIDIMSVGTLAQVTSRINDETPFEPGSVSMEIDTERFWGDAIIDTEVSYDYDSVMTHEFGHIAGLLHNADMMSVMYSGLLPNTRNINIDDRDEYIMERLY